VQIFTTRKTKSARGTERSIAGICTNTVGQAARIVLATCTIHSGLKTLQLSFTWCIFDANCICSIQVV